MIKLLCDKCKKEMIIQSVLGTVPLNYPLKNYCSDECVQKSKEEPAPS